MENQDKSSNPELNIFYRVREASWPKPLRAAANAYVPLIPNYFQGHQCRLPPVIESSDFNIKCSKWKKVIFDLMAVKTNDLRARNIYKSYAAFCAEKYRHFKYYPLSIHPFSTLRLGLEIIFVISILFCIIILPVHFSERKVETDILCYYALYSTDFMVVINIIANFFTGYVEGKTNQHVILDLRKIFCKYIKTWLIIDILSASSFLCHLIFVDAVSPYLILTCMKLLRIPMLYIYTMNIMTAFNFQTLMKVIVEIFILIFSYLMWNISFQFAAEYIAEGSYSPAMPRKNSWLTMSNLWNATHKSRFIYAFERAVGMLRKNSNVDLLSTDGNIELFCMVAWSVAQFLVFHCGLKYIIGVFGCESAASKYFTMTRQVEMYMQQRKFPPRIKKKVLKFYTIRYLSSFFMEGPILSCVSGQLREDIIMHTGRQLVRELEFLKQLPRSLLLQIGVKLKLVIFIAGDIIYKINSMGDCLYFIDKGTVAVYSESGKEVCHLEDGDFFGEVALVMKQRFRTTSVVAVSNCELFKLDREDFDSSIACYPTVYEHIKKVATHRYERTCVLDERYKTEMSNESSYTKEKI